MGLSTSARIVTGSEAEDNDRICKRLHLRGGAGEGVKNRQFIPNRVYR